VPRCHLGERKLRHQSATWHKRASLSLTASSAHNSTSITEISQRLALGNQWHRFQWMPDKEEELVQTLAGQISNKVQEDRCYFKDILPPQVCPLQPGLLDDIFIPRGGHTVLNTARRDPQRSVQCASAELTTPYPLLPVRRMSTRHPLSTHWPP